MAEKVERYKPVFPKRDPEWRGSEIVINGERLIDKGTFGDIFEVKASVAGKPCNGVIKEYRDRGYPEYEDESRKYINELVENSMRGYELVRKAGLPVFSTYRFEEGKRRIFMTNGNTDEVICVSANNLPDTKEEEIKNLQNFCEKLKRCYTVAAEQGIRLAGDSYFFLINRENQTLDFVIGDFDNVESAGIVNPLAPKALHNTIQFEKQQLVDALEQFFKKFYPSKNIEYFNECMRLLDIDPYNPSNL